MIHTNLCGVVCSSKDQFRCTIVTGANVRDVGFILDKDLGTSKIAELQHASARVEKKILRLDITVADALRVDVGKSSEQLVGVEFDLKHGHCGLHFVEVARGTIDGLRDKFEDQVQVDFIFLGGQKDIFISRYPDTRSELWSETHPFSIGVVECFELNYVWVTHDTHNLQLAVLKRLLVPSSLSTKEEGHLLLTLKRLS